jgi:hypothetical protein
VEDGLFAWILSPPVLLVRFQFPSKKLLPRLVFISLPILEIRTTIGLLSTAKYALLPGDRSLSWAWGE